MKYTIESNWKHPVSNRHVIVADERGVTKPVAAFAYEVDAKLALAGLRMRDEPGYRHGLLKIVGDYGNACENFGVLAGRFLVEGTASSDERDEKLAEKYRLRREIERRMLVGLDDNSPPETNRTKRGELLSLIDSVLKDLFTIRSAIETAKTAPVAAIWRQVQAADIPLKTLLLMMPEHCKDLSEESD